MNDSLISSIMGLVSSLLPDGNGLARLLGKETTRYGTLRLYHQALQRNINPMGCFIGMKVLILLISTYIPKLYSPSLYLKALFTPQYPLYTLIPSLHLNTLFTPQYPLYTSTIPLYTSKVMQESETSDWLNC
jgi:hypothetical protein